jgi:PUA domain protein
MPKIEKIRKRHLLKKREQKHEIERIEKALGTALSGIDAKTRFERGILDTDDRVLLLNEHIIFFEDKDQIYPTLRAILEGVLDLPKITVDMGAVRYVVNGADIMRPGVTAIDDMVRKGSIVKVVDETHGKPLAVGVALMSAEDMRSAKGGKVVSTKHHINDALWDFSKS